MTQLEIIIGYLVIVLALGLFSGRFFRGTAGDFFHASHSIGPFVLLMTLFGTAMTSFAIVGSTGEAYQKGIGVYGLMASWSGLVHSACFFLVGIKLWALGKRNGYTTQIQFFRDRFESQRIGWVLFPILVALLIPYILIGILGAGITLNGLTIGQFPGAWYAGGNGGVAFWLGAGVICLVVLLYVFFGGIRGTAWANTLQTLVFLATGVIAFFMISSKLGGVAEATQRVDPSRLVRGNAIGQMEFLTYCFVPLSVAAFPHIFQNWMTAKSANTFRMPIVWYPVCMLILWLPCILIGIWATGAILPGTGELVIAPGTKSNQVMSIMVSQLTSPMLGGLLGAGILAAIMSSLDSQFLSLGSMFTNDIVIHHFGENRFTERQKVLIARVFVVAIVAVTYFLAWFVVNHDPKRIFVLGVWCFSGFSGLFPLVVASLYWRRLTKAGAYASLIANALIWFFLFHQAGYGDEKAVAGMVPATFTVIGSAIVMIVVSLFTASPSRETLEKFFPNQQPKP